MSSGGHRLKDFEIILIWVTIFGYVVSFVLQLIGQVIQKEKLKSIGFFLLWPVFAVHTAVGLIHWLLSGHPPFTTTFELNLTGTWFTMLIYLAFERWSRIEKPIALVVVPIVFLVFGYGYMQGVKLEPMGPVFQSPWLWVHVTFAWLAFGSYSVASGAAVFYLMKNRNPDSTRLSNVPPTEVLDITAYRFVVLGVINHAIMIVSGAIWAKNLWGHYWTWDPLETWSLISFLFYSFYLHTRRFWKWRDKRAAILTVVGLLLLIISFWGVQFFGPTLHPGP